MEPVIDKRTELEKFYDNAYQQGFNHCRKMAELLLTKLNRPETFKELDKFINEKFPNHMKQQTTTQ